MPGVLDATDLAEIRAAFTEVLPSTCTVQRMTLTDKLSRGAWANVATGVACWLIDGSQSLPALMASMLTTGTLKIPGARRMIFSHGQDVRAGDQIVMSSVTYAVKGEVKAGLDLAPCLLVDVEIVRVAQT